jgi:tellurite resistance protein TerA
LINLQSGQNLALTQLRFVAIVRWSPATAGLVLDASAYLLGANGKVESDAGFLFYGQPSVANGAATLDPSATTFTLDLGRLPADTERVALALTIEQGARRGQRFDQVAGLTLTVTGDSEPIEFGLDTQAMQEAAVILGEFYKRNGAWKIRAMGQGFHGGLGPLASHFGVEISDDPDQAAPPAPAPAPAPPVSLNKITLEKRKPVSLDKGAGSFGEILVNLNWSRKPASTGGWNPFKKEAAVDLDVGCMFELRDGRKGVIQALGNNFGSFNDTPWVQLMGDDRTGAVTEGENLRINGTHWADFKRILLFAFIYEGVPNWASADAIVTLKTPGQPELAVKLDSHSNRQTMCAVALLENDGGRIRVSKLVDYYAGHPEMDQAHNFGFRWEAGSK